jgi:acyl carrier protein
MTRLAPTRNDVCNLLVRLLHEVGKIPLEKIHDDSTVDGELQMQSVVFIEIQVALEDTYEVELDPVRMVELNRLATIVDYIFDSVTVGLSR